MQPSLQAKGPVSFQTADLAYKLCPKNAKVGQTDYRSLLSVTEFNLLVRKMVATFEGDVQSLGEDMPRAACHATHCFCHPATFQAAWLPRFKPTVEKVAVYRQVIIFWNRTMRDTMTDLDDASAREVRLAIEEGTAFDEQARQASVQNDPLL